MFVEACTCTTPDSECLSVVSVHSVLAKSSFCVYGFTPNKTGMGQPNNKKEKEKHNEFISMLIDETLDRIKLNTRHLFIRL